MAADDTGEFKRYADSYCPPEMKTITTCVTICSQILQDMSSYNISARSGEYSEPTAFLIVTSPEEYDTFIESGKIEIMSYHKSGKGLKIPKHVPDRSLQYRVQEIGSQERIITTAHFDLEQPQAILENSVWLVNFIKAAAESYSRHED